MRLEIHQPGRDTVEKNIPEGVYPIGADDDNAIALPHADVTAQHAILIVQSDSWWIEDLNHPPGTFVDGEPVSGRARVQPGQQITIGPYGLVLENGRAATKTAAQKPASPSPESSAPTHRDEVPGQPESVNPERAAALSIKRQIHTELLERMDLKRMIADHTNVEDLEQKALATVQEIVKDVRDRLPAGIDPSMLIKEVYDEAIALGPLEDLVADPAITEIMVNGHDQIYIEREGQLTLTDRVFLNDSSVLAIIERIVSPIGRRIDESQPYVDARLKDGSRVNAIIPPLSLVGPCLTIRKFSKEPFTDADLIGFGTMTRYVADFIDLSVQLRKNIIVSGGTGSGKTTLLNVVSNYLPERDRIVTIEDAAELRLGQIHVVRLEARPPNIEGRGAVEIRDLVRNALRMRPDRIVVGECRGGEALDMLQAMNTGHEGSLTTVHANTPRDVISRLETMVLMSGMDLPIRAIREQIASAIDLIVQTARLHDGSRKITKITEVVGLEGDRLTMQDIFEYHQTGVDAEGVVQGHFAPTGAVPHFMDEVAAKGLRVDQRMFDPQSYGELD